MHPIFANAGVPMLFLQMPLLLVSLPVVIAVEAWLCRRWLGVPWKQAWKWVGIANLVSTVFGFPILWIALVILQMLVGGGSFPELDEPWFSVYTVTVQAPWLLPIEERLDWMIPIACIVLLIPAFFVSVAVEGFIYRRAFAEDCETARVTRATWLMNLVSYAILLAAALVLLVGPALQSM